MLFSLSKTSILFAFLCGMFYCGILGTHAQEGEKTITLTGNTESGKVVPNENLKNTSKIQKKELSLSGTTQTGSINESASGGKINTTIETEEELKIKKDINTYIIESYKAQGTRVIKELSINLSKTIPDEGDRQEAYKKIQNSLELRNKRLEESRMTETKKMIVEEFLNHMIDLLDKKIQELE